MPTEREVAWAAEVIAESPLIDSPKLPPESWHGLARAILEKAEIARAGIRQPESLGGMDW